MFKLKLILLAICVLAIFGLSTFLFMPAQPVSADTVYLKIPASVLPAADTANGPTVVKVGIYVLNIGKLDTSSGAYTVDFYLSFTSDTPSDPSKFEYSNGRATSTDQSENEPTSKFYRIQASLVSNLDMSKYPFDKHNLTIEIEDKEQTVNTQIYQVYLPDSGLDPAVSLP